MADRTLAAGRADQLGPGDRSSELEDMYIAGFGDITPNQSVLSFRKRAVDVVGALVGIVLFGPLYLFIAASIRMDGGPAIFRHKRVGLNGKPFYCLKFRTMVVDAELMLKRHLEENPAAKAEWAESRKLRNDPRVTKIGRILRATSLDEIPQFFNVLAGEMSLVGPRPIMYDELPKYKKQARHYLSCRPGISGLWQVSGRNDVSLDRQVCMDAYYAMNWTVWLDIQIILKTFVAVISRRGAF